MKSLMNTRALHSISIFLMVIVPIWLCGQTPEQLIEFNDAAPTGGYYWPTPTGVDGTIFYQYENSGGSNHYLYATNGTAGGSELLRTFNGPISRPHIISNDQYLFLVDDDGDSKYEVWTSDGTPGGTEQLIEFSQTSSDWPVATVINDKVFYQYNTSPSSGYLYVTNGTSAGSSQLMSFNNMLNFPHIKDQTQYLFWTDNNGDYKHELWTSDGTSGGTQQLFETQSVNGAGSPAYGTEAGANMFYCFLTQSNTGELYVTDGTPGGSSLVGSSVREFQSPHAIGNQFMVTTDADYDVNGEIWTSDGTSAGTTMLFESSTAYYAGAQTNTIVVDGMAYYSYFTTNSNYQLIASDGTSGGTNLLKTFDESFVSHHTINGNQYLFIADDDNDSRLEIWTSDGSVGGTSQLHEFSNTVGSYFPTYFERDGKKYYHYTGSSGNTYSLASTDGTSGGTSEIFSSNQRLIRHHDINNFGGQYLFIADDNGNQNLEVWTSDGSSGGTESVFEFGAAPANNTPIVSGVNGINYYQYENSGGGSSDLYVSDGTSAGSSNLKTFNGKINIPHSINGDQYLFIADDDQDGRQEVWSVSGLADVDEFKNQQAFQIYPNPARDFLTITSDESSAKMNYTIIDLMGKSIDAGQIQNVSNSTISVQDLPKGVYILRLKNNNYDEQFRIVKQ